MLAAIAMGAALRLILPVMPGNDLIRLFASICCAATVFFVACFALNVKELKGLVEWISKKR